MPFGQLPPYDPDCGFSRSLFIKLACVLPHREAQTMLNGTHKGQSAIEFITTYGMVFLVIIIAITAVAMFISFPRTILPDVCSFYSGFNCVDSLFVSNTAYGGSTLIVVATFEEPGVFSIGSFNAILGYKNSTSGSCTPNTLVDGESTFCVAQFPMAPVNGSTYYGTMNIQGNYCANSAQNLSYAGCLPTNGIFNFSGNMRIQPTASENVVCSDYVLCYIPITITDTNTIQGIPSGFQEEVSILPDSAAYNAYEANDLGNIRFQYNGRDMPSWCEINCVSTSTSNAVFWVKLPVSLNPTGTAGNSITIWMRFLGTSTEYDGIDAGEAPSLSIPYAKYDNGARVFNFYDNFEGTSSSPSSSWTVNTIGAGASATVNNGLTVTMTQTDSGIGIFTVSTYSTPLVAEADLTSYSNNCGSPYTGIFESLNSVMDTVNFAEPENSYLLSTGGSTLTYFAVTTPTASTNIYGPVSLPALPVVWGVAWLGTGSEATRIGSTSYTSTDSTLKFGRYHLGIANNAGFCLSTSAYQWFRARDYPPGGVQPAYSLGSFTEVS